MAPGLSPASKLRLKAGLRITILQDRKTKGRGYIDRVRLKNQLLKIFQVILPFIFSPFLCYATHINPGYRIIPFVMVIIFTITKNFRRMEKFWEQFWNILRAFLDTWKAFWGHFDQFLRRTKSMLWVDGWVGMKAILRTTDLSQKTRSLPSFLQDLCFSV